MSEDNLQIELPATDIASASDFEKERKKIYSHTRSGDTDRGQLLTELAGLMATRERYADSGLPISILDRALNIATSNEGDQGNISGPRYRLTLGPDGSLADVFFLNPIPEDPDKTARAQHVSKHIPWGPKQNGSSFRTHPSRLEPHKIHL